MGFGALLSAEWRSWLKLHHSKPNLHIRPMQGIIGHAVLEVRITDFINPFGLASL
jgi:hypothetical protein